MIVKLELVSFVVRMRKVLEMLWHIKWLLNLVLVLFVCGCAHRAAERRVDVKLAQESGINTRVELWDEVARTLKGTPILNSQQRGQLNVLYASMRKQDERLAVQFMRLWAILLRDVLNANYDFEEVEVIQKRMKGLNNEILFLVFDSVEKMNAILDRSLPASQRLMRDFAELRLVGYWDF